MIDEITDFLFGLKMTIISGIFLLIAVIFMIFGIDTPVYLNPAWGTVIISGIPMLLLAMTRLIREKWISSALLIAIAMVASLLIGEIFAAGEVAWIMALGALLEDWTVERAKKGLRNLINLTPQTGRRIVDGAEEVVPVDEIKIGDTLRILPGESVPVDGEVIKGTSSLDQSIMTGESLPIDKGVGDEVFCGTMNMYGAIDIKATSLGENSSLQKLIDLVKAAAVIVVIVQIAGLVQRGIQLGVVHRTAGGLQLSIGGREQLGRAGELQIQGTGHGVHGVCGHSGIVDHAAIQVDQSSHLLHHIGGQGGDDTVCDLVADGQSAGVFDFIFRACGADRTYIALPLSFRWSC